MRTYRSLKDSEKLVLALNDVSSKSFNDRKRTGWDPYDAIHLPKGFQLIDGYVGKYLKLRNDKYVVIYPEHYYEMQQNDVNESMVVNRIKNGATLEQAIKHSYKNNEFDFKKQTKQKATIFNTQYLKSIPYSELLFQQACKQFLEAK
ncbi:hypothetical protein QI193_02815 [Staphylococcus saprophyticus]|nr:hypothetical protein [Staphylococcus saprophyticus]